MHFTIVQYDSMSVSTFCIFNADSPLGKLYTNVFFFFALSELELRCHGESFFSRISKNIYIKRQSTNCLFYQTILFILNEYIKKIAYF